MLKKKDSISKQNSNHEKQIFLLMFPKGEEWYYITVKRLSTLLKKIQKVIGIFVL